jgi:gluconolactonase
VARTWLQVTARGVPKEPQPAAEAGLSVERSFYSLDGKTGFADGIRCDEDGNVWAGMGWVGDGYDGVHVFAPDGTRIGQIRMPEIISNIAWGGKSRNRLFMTGSTSLYAVYVETRGGPIGG